LREIVRKETWTADDHKQLLELFGEVPSATEKLRVIVGQLQRDNPEPRGAVALKIGIAQYMLCRFAEAIETLGGGTDNKDRRYFQAMCYKATRQYDRAAEEFDRARSRGWDETEIEIELTELQALSGDLAGAEKALAAVTRKVGRRADTLYLRGLIRELDGRGDEAVEAYEQARTQGGTHVDATFRLAYYYDLHGEEGRAIELYQSCLGRPPAYANALLNLAVLYEDAGQYDEASACLRQILKCNPGNARARLFLKDVEASKTMYFDEEQAKRVARRNAVLDIPVTDFELSVRARNCLKKMNIRTLGDLVETTEAELLAYKNFGETSLKEIKEMLTAKGLRLGQALEEGSDFGLVRALAPAPPQADEGVLATPLDRIEFSVRSRRALEHLHARTLGDLVNMTEAELLGCRNFGQTSLNEVRQRLSEYGLSLRGKG
jgi:DNA-directed RNA polymerase subunit alpha